jgi:hypothetical protein
MTVNNYEAVLEQALRLSPEEQQRLREALAEPNGARIIAPEELRELIAHTPHSAPLKDTDRAQIDSWLAAADALAAVISEAWQDDMSAVEAVRDIRRDL